jgi:hypothetical protein
MSLRIICLALGWLGAITIATPAQPPDLRLISDGPVLQPGDTATVEIRLRHESLELAPVSGAGLQLSFDHRWLRFIDLKPASLFGADTLLLVKLLDDEDAISFALTQRAGAGIRGDHVLLSARFVATEIGTILSAELRLEESMILLTDGDLIEPGTSFGTVSVAPAVVWPGDTNRDGRVDESDLLPIASHFARAGGPRPDRSMTFAPTAAPLWDTPDAVHADVNGDGTIDLADVHALAGVQPAYDAELPALAQVALPIAQGGDKIQLDLAFAGSLMGVSARIRFPEPLVMAAPPDVTPWLGVMPIVTHLRHDAQSGIMGLAISRVRGDAPLAFGQSRIQLMFDVPTQLSVASNIDLLAVSAIQDSGLPTTPDIHLSVVLITSVDRDESTSPDRFELHPNQPNPFNPTTLIRYDVADAGRIRLSIIDLAGRELEVLTDSHHDVGTHAIIFDATRFASGVYVCRLQSESAERIRKITLIK